jgi:Transposase DDE domain group 1
MEPRIRELREDFALRKIPTASFAANALFLEIVRLAYNLVTTFQRTCLDKPWQTLTLPKLRYKLFMLPGELTRPQNRPVLRLRPSVLTSGLPEKILAKIAKLKPLES